MQSIFTGGGRQEEKDIGRDLTGVEVDEGAGRGGPHP